MNKYTKGRTIVYFIRHGNRKYIPNSPGAGLRIPGPGLDANGKKQARHVAKELEKIKDEIDIIYTSSMKRAIETADFIRKKVHKKIIRVPALSEFNQIVWSKRYYHYNYWKYRLWFRKARKVMNEILSKNEGNVILIVGHGNSIKGFLSSKMKLGFRHPWKMDYDNCGITKARFKGIKLDYLYYYNRVGLGV